MILSAKFVCSKPRFDPSLPSVHTEVAFLGRSNVGKSSLINALCNQKNLAKSSSTPGKTQLINFFEVVFRREDEKITFNFVDLPGFGYAKVSKNLKKVWSENLDEFLRLRTSIKLFIHLIDSRHLDLKIDCNTKEYLQSFLKKDQKILQVFTKIDKINQCQMAKLLNTFPQALVVSSFKKKGLQELREKILQESLQL